MLDRSKNYLSIFVDKLEIDYQLPKYGEALEEIKKDIVDELVECSHFTRESIDESLEKDPDSLLNFTAKNNEELNERENKIKSLISIYKAKKDSVKKGILISSDKFDKLNSKDLIVLTENLGHRNRLNKNGWFDLFVDADKSIIEFDKEYLNTLPWWKRWFYKFEDWKIKRDAKKEEMKGVKIDVFEFFRLVKLSTEKSEKEYIDRSQPFLLAIERAKRMGQQALIDKYLTGMFIAKYESILRAENFNKSISESQIVEFAKKSKKGMSLDYIKNYTRPIPDNVVELKKKADSLYVFDNYCVLHYDPDKKSYSMTAKEQEQERQRKADPILFGMIEGSRKLYYIADWVDEYCDLTLEEFLKQSGLTEKDIEIPKEIVL